MSAIIGNMPASRSWVGVAWNGTKFCAIAQSTNIVAVSYDGINWTEHATLPFSATWVDIASNGNVFCATCHPMTAGHCFVYSSDGITWAESNVVHIDFRSNRIAFGNGLFVSASDHGPRLYTSPDGAVFTERSIVYTYWNDVAWSGSFFCCDIIITPTNTAAISANGITWTYTTLPLTTQWGDMAGGGGKICILPLSASSQCVVSSNGTDWQIGTFPVSVVWLTAVWNGAVFCALPATGSSIYISKDCISWEQKSLPISDTWKSMSHNGTATLLLSATKSILIDDWSTFWCNFKGQSEILV